MLRELLGGLLMLERQFYRRWILMTPVTNHKIAN
jgi:hypothetical protein